MNERIKELAEQAGAIRIHGKPKDRALVGYDNIEKFAELIVRECADFIKQDQGTGEVLSSRLKEHFGVEESEEYSACPLCGEDGGTTCGMPGCQY